MATNGFDSSSPTTSPLSDVDLTAMYKDVVASKEQLKHTPSSADFEKAIGQMNTGIATALGKMETTISKEVGELKASFADVKLWALIAALGLIAFATTITKNLF